MRGGIDPDAGISPCANRMGKHALPDTPRRKKYTNENIYARFQSSVGYQFVPYLAQIATNMNGCVAPMTFDLDLCHQGYLAVTLPFLWIILICGTNTTHEGTIYHIPFSGQYVKGQGHTGQSTFLNGYVAPMTFDLDLCLQGYLAVTLPFLWIILICGTNTTHEGTICHILFSGQ